MTIDEVTDILEGITDPFDRALLETFYATGYRSSEMQRLTTDDPLPPRAKRYCDAYMQGRQGLLFPYSKYTLREHCRKYGTSPSALRAAHRQHLYEATGNWAEVSRHMGYRM